MRLITSASVVVFVLLLFALWLFQPVEPVVAALGVQDCRRVELTDRDTGWAVSGAEDLALAPDGNRVIIAAHDRRNATRPNGAIYALDLWTLGSATSLGVVNLLPETQRQRTFRPHGIALSEDGSRLAIVNRVAEREAVVEIGDLTATNWFIDKRLTGNSLCRANDLVFLEREVETLMITLDRANCGPSVEDLIPGSTTGRIALWDGGRLNVIREGLSFPNGISGAFVAETRKSRILRPAGEPIRLSGGPDNITRLDDRHILVAVHPSLRRLWLYLQDVWPTAPSRIVRTNVLTAEVDVLFDDPGGELFSGATSAVLTDKLLIAGSVADDGLLVCERGQS
ncbi:MAG: hypothetical protein AAF293_08275 [Pseudomonadota bacterium]